MKILVVNWQDRENPQAGGAEIHLHETFGRIASAGHDVTVLASGWPGAASTADLDGIHVHRTGGRLTFRLAASRYWRWHLRSEPFDVIVEDLNKVPLLTTTWGVQPVVLLVHHLFGLTAFREASLPVAAATWLLERSIPRVYRKTPVVSVSESTAEDLVKRGISRDRIVVIPNGVDLERYRPAAEPSEFPEPSLLYVGRLKRYKRVDLILQALARLRGQGVSCALRIAGSGDDRPRLERLTARLRLQDVVRFLGFVPEEEKVELFQRSWVHLLTSPNEGWGIANMEAAACGTPTVASDSPGLRDSVRPGETGLLVPHADVPALAAAIGLVLEDHDLRRRMGHAARTFALGHSWDSTAQRLEGFLRQQVAATRASSGRAEPADQVDG